MTGVSALLVCPACESPWQSPVEEVHGSTALVRCPQCDHTTTFLEAAAAAWALGHMSREDFFDLAAQIAPDDVGDALAALVNIAAWWDRRAHGDAAGDGGR